MRDQMCFEATPFEHYMLVAGNLAQRCVDAVWVVFGFEPLGFRLCDRYDGPEFCYGLVNPVLKGYSASGLIELPPQVELLCRPTTRRSYQMADNSSEGKTAVFEKVTQAATEIATGRAAALDKAVYCVHTHVQCEEWLIERLRTLWKTEGLGDGMDLLKARLTSLYPQHERHDSFTAKVASVVTLYESKTDECVLRKRSDEMVSLRLWSELLRILRCALDDLVREYGNPGGAYFCDTKIMSDSKTWSKFGFK